MKQETKEWIEAGKLFSLSATVEFVCPECRQGQLKSEDLILPSEEVFERRIFCELCGTENFLRIRSRPQIGS